MNAANKEEFLKRFNAPQVKKRRGRKPYKKSVIVVAGGSGCRCNGKYCRTCKARTAKKIRYHKKYVKKK